MCLCASEMFCDFPMIPQKVIQAHSVLRTEIPGLTALLLSLSISTTLYTTSKESSFPPFPACLGHEIVSWGPPLSFSFLSTCLKLESFEKRLPPLRKCPPSDWLSGQTWGPFSWLNDQCVRDPAHCGWSQPLGDGPELCKKARGTNQEEQTSKKYSSLVSTSGPTQALALTSLMMHCDVKVLNPFFPKLFLIVAFGNSSRYSN